MCLTLHTNEGSYLAHTQGKKHQTNLARRAAKDSKDPGMYAEQMRVAQLNAQKLAVPTKTFIKIGSPGYQVRSSNCFQLTHSLMIFTGYQSQRSNYWTARVIISSSLSTNCRWNYS